jgi:histidine triad (HIT) family protein
MCLFCDIAEQRAPADFVYRDDVSVAFLDLRPLFPGHTLLIPRVHVVTLAELPTDLLEPYFGAARLLARAMEEVLEAQGSFVALNNKVSQSVPHLHTHVVPRKRKDGLRGFFWPRGKYSSPDEMGAVAEHLRAGIATLQAKEVP